MTNILEEFKNEILKADEDAEVTFIKKGENGAARDVLLTVEHSFGSLANTAETESFFVDKEEAGVEFFMSRVYVIREVSPEKGALICLTESLINDNLVGGAFGYDAESGTVSYTYSVPIAETCTEEQKKMLAESAMATALSEAQKYAGDLLLVANAD